MPTPVYDLSPHQLEWLYNNQTLTGGEPLGEEGNCSQQQQMGGSPNTTTQILFTESSEKLKSVPEVEHDDEETDVITDGNYDMDMAAAVARKRRPGEAIMMPEIAHHQNGSIPYDIQCPRAAIQTQKQQKKLSSLFPHTNERLTWEQSFANLKVYHGEYGNCNVPREFPSMPQLGGWVHRQRLKKKSPRKYGGLTDCQVNQLDELGFCWFIRCMNGNNIQKQQDQ